MRSFADAAKSLHRKPVVVVEGIHTCTNESQTALHQEAAEFAAHLVRIHNRGLINVVYTASDFKGATMLYKVSGHSRLTTLLFPRIPDKEFAKQLKKLVYKRELDIFDNKPHRKFDFCDKNKELPAGYDFVLDKEADTNYIVERLDSHMGDAICCLRAIVEDKAEVKAAVDVVIEQAIPNLADALLGKICEGTHRLSFIAVSNLLLEALCQETVSQVHWFSVVMKGAPKLKSEEVTKAVDQLVGNHLLSYIDPFHVCLHARRLKWAYLDVVSKDIGIQHVRNEALNQFT